MLRVQRKGGKSCSPRSLPQWIPNHDPSIHRRGRETLLTTISEKVDQNTSKSLGIAKNSLAIGTLCSSPTPRRLAHPSKFPFALPYHKSKRPVQSQTPRSTESASLQSHLTPHVTVGPGRSTCPPGCGAPARPAWAPCRPCPPDLNRQPQGRCEVGRCTVPESARLGSWLVGRE